VVTAKTLDEAQDHRSGAAKQQDTQCGVKFGCHIDLGPGEKPDGCVHDYGVPEDCSHGPRHRSKWTCPFWAPVKPALAAEAARGAEHIAMIQERFWRAGAEAMREAAAQSFEQSEGRLWRIQAAVIRSLPAPEIDR